MLFEQITNFVEDIPPPIRRLTSKMVGKYAVHMFMVPWYVPAIARGKLYVEKPISAEAEDELKSDKPLQGFPGMGCIDFQFNPESFPDVKDVEYVDIAPVGRQVPDVEFVRGQARRFSLKLLVDATEDFAASGMVGRIVGLMPPAMQRATQIARGTIEAIKHYASDKKVVPWGVVPILNQFRMLVSPLTPETIKLVQAGELLRNSAFEDLSVNGMTDGEEDYVFIDSSRFIAPPRSFFMFGNHIAAWCVCKKCKIDYLRFEHMGTPVRATVELELIEVPQSYKLQGDLSYKLAKRYVSMGAHIKSQVSTKTTGQVFEW